VACGNAPGMYSLSTYTAATGSWLISNSCTTLLMLIHHGLKCVTYMYSGSDSVLLGTMQVLHSVTAINANGPPKSSCHTFTSRQSGQFSDLPGRERFMPYVTKGSQSLSLRLIY